MSSPFFREQKYGTPLLNPTKLWTTITPHPLLQTTDLPTNIADMDLVNTTCGVDCKQGSPGRCDGGSKSENFSFSQLENRLKFAANQIRRNHPSHVIFPPPPNQILFRHLQQSHRSPFFPTFVVLAMNRSTLLFFLFFFFFFFHNVTTKPQKERSP